MRIKYTSIKLAVSVLALGALSGCATADKIANIGKAPEMAQISNPMTAPDYQPVSLPMPSPR